MTILDELFDPDRWIASGRKLRDYRRPSKVEAWPSVEAYFSERPELAAHVGRWLNRIEEIEGEKKALTEVDLRALWDATRQTADSENAPL